MLHFNVFCCFALAICAVNGKFIARKIGLQPARNAPKTKSNIPVWTTIIQKLDHHNPADARTWKQWYIYNSQFYQQGGPLFIFLGGEWEIEPSWLLTGQMYDMARQHGGYMFYLEHRFYGESSPLRDLTTNSLQYLTSQQALGDLAQFITTVKNAIDVNSKVVVVGASFSASLATWSRLLYPNLIDMVYASGAPLIALEDFYQYHEVVGRQLFINSKDCYRTFSEAFTEIDRLFTFDDGVKYLDQVFGTCTPLQNRQPYKAYFYQSLLISWDNLVQYARPGNILNECNKLITKPGDSLQKLVAYYKEQLGNFCMSDYDDFVGFYSNTKLNPGAGRQWTFQTCNEFGFFQTTSSPNQPFGHSVLVDYFEQLCVDIFGPQYTPQQIRANIDYTNSVYGGLNGNLTYVVSVHGNVDPWHAIGLKAGLHDLAPAYLVDGTAHCADLESASASDSQQMAAVKQAVKDHITQWLL